jgi:hypothetical protein
MDQDNTACNPEEMMDNYWKKMIENYNPECDFVADGVLNHVVKSQPIPSVEHPTSEKYLIQFNDGRLIASSSVWYCGHIPSEYQKFFPNTAKMISRFEYIF